MSDYDDTKAATARYWTLVNKEQARQGLPPIKPPEPELPASMKKLLYMNSNGATEAFIAENQRRINAGLPPIKTEPRG